MDMIKKVFNGDERLVITFWVWGFIVSWIYYFAVGFILGALGIDNALIIAVVQLIWLVFIALAVWRSSDKYTGASIWAILAKIWVVLSVLGTLASGFGYGM